MAPVCCAADPRSGVTETNARCWSAGSTLTRGGDFSIVRTVRDSEEQPQRFYEARSALKFRDPFLLVCIYHASQVHRLDWRVGGSLRPVDSDYNLPCFRLRSQSEIRALFAAVRPVAASAPHSASPRRRRVPREDSRPRRSRRAKRCPRAARQNAYRTRLLRGD